jgi:L-asparaginase / beta-aspartyl-peptidase
MFMIKRFAILVIIMSLATFVSAQEKAMLVIHGGAGTITRAKLTPEREREYRAKLEEVLRTGHSILTKGGSSLDAVEACIKIMEDSPLFNAGKGSVFTADGRNEMDASIMNGRTKQAGAVTAVSIIKNPISAARAVMEKSKHVLLAGRGAEIFATRMGLEIVDPSYFWTERRWKELQDELLKEQQQPPKAELGEVKFGTVGVLALDKNGDLAAGTSTGGRTNKQFGRVGDTPIIGAGNYADNATCAVSGTGHGEFFIRGVVAYDVAAIMKYRGLGVQQAADMVVQQLGEIKGEGGLIALDAKGNFAMPFNTEGMYRGWIGADGVPHVAIYRD